MISFILSAARSCFVRCIGCYNHFGSAERPELPTSTIVSFVKLLKGAGVGKITLGGGDPLARSDIVELVRSIYNLGVSINLDTVGTSFLQAAETIFEGKRHVQLTDMETVGRYLTALGIPLDGANPVTAAHFRKGRSRLFCETLDILAASCELAIPVTVNTVVTKQNVTELPAVLDLICAYTSVKRWQLFQYTASGRGGFGNRALFELSEADFCRAVAPLRNACSPLIIEPKTNGGRKHQYLLVTADGEAWMPFGTPGQEWDRDIDSTSEHISLGCIQSRQVQEGILYRVQKELETSRCPFEP